MSPFFLPEWTEGKWGLRLWPDYEQKYGHCFAVSHFKLVWNFCSIFLRNLKDLCSASAMKILCYSIAVSWNHLTEYAEVSPLGIGTVLTTSTSFTQKCVLLVSFAFRKQRRSEEKVMFSVFGLVPGTQIANFWGVPVRKSQIRKFLWCPSPQIANPKICKEKSSVFDPVPHWYACNIFVPM